MWYPNTTNRKPVLTNTNTQTFQSLTINYSAIIKVRISFLLSFFFSLSLFLWDAFDICGFDVLSLRFWIIPLTNLLYLDLEDKINVFRQKMMYREKKIRKKKHFIMSQYLQEKV